MHSLNTEQISVEADINKNSCQKVIILIKTLMGMRSPLFYFTIMNIELQEKLFEKYPKIFRQKDLSMNETCMCWGIELLS